PGGFAEAGEEGRARDAALRRIAEERQLTIAGPNCAGIIHLPAGARFAATFLPDMPPGPNGQGGIPFPSQSGPTLQEASAAPHRQRLPLATLVSVGNAMQLGVTDFLEHIGEDAATSVVLLYIESLEDEARFRTVARRVAAAKPVVAMLGGRTQ